MDFFTKSYSKEEILKKLEEYAARDAKPHTGRLFSIAFETGLDDFREIAHSALTTFADKNILDFLEFPSAIRMEKEIVDVAKSLMHGDDEVVGTYTFGGTESVFLAVKAARDQFILKHGLGTLPEIILPVTGHPCYNKAAEYMGLIVKRIPVNPETLEAEPDLMSQAITENTVMIVGSAPNWPFGTIDPIKELAEIALEKNLWMHVDACVGGFVLPFMKKLGEDIPDFDFSIPGVSSISLDPHKYAFAPHGSSVVLFKKTFYKMYSTFANIHWPGYIIVNPAVLSSRSAGPLAAAWAGLHYMGEAGYLDLTRKTISARDKIISGLQKLGYRVLGRQNSCIVTFSSEDVNVFKLSDAMLEKGWWFMAQRGIEDLNIPPSIHLTITPIHEKVSQHMLADLEDATKKVKKIPSSDVEDMVQGMGLVMRTMMPAEVGIETIGSMLGQMEKQMSTQGPRILKALGFDKGIPKEMATTNELFNSLPPEIVEPLATYVTIEMFRRGG
jgi:glutamate/tyrosine decarboxylase-like PLP-dependent enzyme